MARVQGESIWMVAGILLIVLTMIAVIAIVAGIGPSNIMDLMQSIMTGIAMYMISQLHGILR